MDEILEIFVGLFPQKFQEFHPFFCILTISLIEMQHMVMFVDINKHCDAITWLGLTLG